MADVSIPLPLSAAQQGIWFGQQLDLQSPIYGTAECIVLSGNVQPELLARAVQQVLSEAAPLNVQFGMTAEAPSQRMLQRAWDVPVRTLAADEDAVAQVQRYARADLAEAFDLERDALVRSVIFAQPGGVCCWYLAAHHIVIDGFGFVLLMQRAAELYMALRTGSAPKPAWLGGIEAVLESDAAYRAGVDYARDQTFWRERFADFESAHTLSGSTPFPDRQALRAKSRIPTALRARLDALGRAEGGSWADALLATVAAHFYQETGAHEVVIGLPMMGRMGSRALRVPSMFMNIAPLRIGLHAADDFATLCARVVAERRALMPHARYRYEDLRRDLKLLGSRRRLFGPVVNIMPFDYGVRFEGARARVHNLSSGPVEDLSIGVYAGADGQGLALNLDANPAAYTAQELARLSSSLDALLERWSGMPLLCLHALRPKQEGRATEPPALLRGEALRSVPRDVAVRIFEHAVRTSSRPALETLLGERLDYATLVREALALAGSLRERGVVAGQLVAIALPRSSAAVCAMLAVLFAGAAYVPLDPEGPGGRLAAIVEDAHPALVITHSALRGKLPDAWSGQLLLVDAPSRSVALSEPVPAAPEQAAYVIYTSGSTGRPNGVVVSRAALSHFVAAALQRYGFDEHARILQFAPLHFDASVEEIFLALCAGGVLALRDEEMLQSMPAFLRGCAALRVSVLDLPTAFWHELSFALSSQALALPACVRTVIIGGEAALPERVQRWQRCVAASVRLLNTYGPTETTVVALSAELGAASSEPMHVPIGMPLPGSEALVLDATGLPVAAGDVGELYLLGPQLACGYLHRPQLERARFVEMPLLPGRPRAYRTGDLVRSAADGSVVFVGRAGDELKISGQRVDPREVEAALLRHPELSDAAVSVHEQAHAKYLVAHVVPRATGDVGALTSSLRLYAQHHLLAAAVPRHFVVLSALPKTTSGKIDRRALGRIEVSAVAAASTREPSAAEAQLLDVWREVLGGRQLNLDADVFEQGAQSLQVIQVANRLSARLGREVAAALLFDHPSIAGLAAALERSPKRAPSIAFPRDAMRDDAALADGLYPPQGHLAEIPRQALLTGATGFVGGQLLRELLARTDLWLVCLVRASDDASARARLLAALYARGIELGDAAARVQVLAADVSRPAFGLSERAFQRLALECDVIYHAAASVSLARSYASLRGSNGLATLEVLRLASSARPKAVHHVSTLAVAHDGSRSALREEYVGLHQGLRDGYAQSKWVAEALAQRAQTLGHAVSVYRLGRVVGPRSAEHVNGEDIVWRMLRAGVALGALPALDVWEPWTPVDDVARAIVQLSRSGSSRVYNLVPAELTSWRTVFAWLRVQGYALEDCSLADFCARLKAAPSHVDKSALAFFEAQQSAGVPAPLTRVERDHTLQALAGVEPFPCVDRALVRRYFDRCVESGLFPAPSGTAPR